MLLLHFFMALVVAIIASESDISHSLLLLTQLTVNKMRTATRKAVGEFIVSENHKS